MPVFKGETFIASMSHELRTPLNSIIGFTIIRLQGLAGEVNAEQQEQFGMVKPAGAREQVLRSDCTGSIEKPINPEPIAGEIEKYLMGLR